MDAHATHPGLRDAVGRLGDVAHGRDLVAALALEAGAQLGEALRCRDGRGSLGQNRCRRHGGEERAGERDGSDTDVHG